MRKTIAILVTLTFFSFSLFAQNRNFTSNFSANSKENIEQNFVTVTAAPLFAQYDLPVTVTQNALSATVAKSFKMIPKVDLPKEPNVSFWQKLQDDPDELTDTEKQEYLDLLFDFYRVSTILNQQLEDAGKPTRYRLEAPPISGINQIEDAEDLDLTVVLQRQINQAKRLKREIESIDQPTVNRKIDDLQDNIIAITRQFDSTNYALQQENNNLRKELAASKLGEIENENYKMLFAKSQKSVEEIFYQMNNFAIPVLALSVGATTNIISDDLFTSYSSQFSPSFSLNFNPSVLLGILDFIDIWANFSNPAANISHLLVDDIFGGNAVTVTYKHHLTNLETGLNVHLSLSKYFDIKRFNWLLKGGIGHFWLIDEIQNTGFTTNIWQGYMYKVETEIYNLSSRCPVGVYASYSFKKTYSNINIGEINNLSLGDKWFGAINFGLKFFLSVHSPLKREER